MTRRQSYRSRLTLRQLLSSNLAVLSLVLLGCGVLTPEEQLLQRFFEASRLFDAAALEKVATVVFNPVTDGIVQDFHVTAVSAVEPTAVGPLRRTANVTAQVRRRNGAESQRTLTATFERHADHWIIVAIQ
jgi:hypothetical protein